jgi:hypothetical protein
LPLSAGHLGDVYNQWGFGRALTSKDLFCCPAKEPTHPPRNQRCIKLVPSVLF